MQSNGFESKEEEKEHREIIYENAVQNGFIRGQALIDARSLCEPDDPFVTEADLEMAKRYLYVCIMKKSLATLRVATPRELAALWGWGARGAARYRAARRRTRRPAEGQE